MYGTVILLRKGGLEHFRFLAKVTQKSGQDSGLDPSSSLPAQPPAQARVFAPPSKEDFVEMHFCVPEMMRVSDTGYPNMTCISYSNGRWRSDRDNDDIWWQIFICQALFLALYVVISPLIPIQSYELWAVAIPTFQAKKMRHTEVTRLAFVHPEEVRDGARTQIYALQHQPPPPSS